MTTTTNPGWWTTPWEVRGRVTRIAVEPIADLMAHDRWNTRCLCGPKVKPTPTGVRGVFAQMIVHHALDGRT